MHMHEVLVNRVGGLSLLRKSVVRLTDRPDMTLAVNVKQQHNTQQQEEVSKVVVAPFLGAKVL